VRGWGDAQVLVVVFMVFGGFIIQAVEFTALFRSSQEGNCEFDCPRLVGLRSIEEVVGVSIVLCLSSGVLRFSWN